MTLAIDITERPTPISGKPRLIDEVRLKIRMLHYSRRTEKTCVFWIRYSISTWASATRRRWMLAA